MTSPSRVAEIESSRTRWVPCTTRLKTSRPNWSTAKGWAHDMPDREVPASICDGPWGARKGPASATASQNTRITEPIRKLRGVVGQSRSQRPRRAAVRGRERTAFIPPETEGAG